MVHMELAQFSNMDLIDLMWFRQLCTGQNDLICAA